VQASHPDLLPLHAVQRRLDDIVVALRTYTKPHGVHVLGQGLGRPVGQLRIGHDRAKTIEAVRLEFDRSLEPAGRGDADHEAPLVVLVNRMRSDLGGEYEVATRLEVQEVPVVGLEPVVRSLPEVGSGVGIDTKALGRLVDTPVRGKNSGLT